MRNVMIAVGNSGNVNLIPCAVKLLDEASAQVRAMAIWALSRLLPQEEFAQLATARRDNEPDEDVKREWDV